MCRHKIAPKSDSEIGNRPIDAVNVLCAQLTRDLFAIAKFLYYLRQRGRYMFLPVFVCLTVCLLARLLKTRAWIWMKCCVSTGVETWTN